MASRPELARMLTAAALLDPKLRSGSSMEAFVRASSDEFMAWIDRMTGVRDTYIEMFLKH